MIPELRPDSIPRELRDRDQWVLWRHRKRGEKHTKVPFQTDGSAASSTDPSTWTSFDSALDALSQDRRFDGLGFVFGQHDPYFGADRDGIDPEGEEARAWMERFGTYCERTPSGRGMHAIGRGSVPQGTNRSEGEIYSSRRFFTVTGDVLRDLPITEAQEAATAYYGWLRRNDSEPSTNGHSEGRGAGPLPPGLAPSPLMDDDEVLDRLRRAKNAREFEGVWSSPPEDPPGYTSASDRDMRLASLVSFYTQDPEQIERIMRQAPCRREKWERKDYLPDRTIPRAIGDLRSTYQQYSTREAKREKMRQGRSHDPEDRTEPEEQIRPEIVAHPRDQKDVLTDTYTAIVEANEPPTMFVRDGRLSKIARDEDGTANIQSVSVDGLRSRMAHAANFVRVDRRGKRTPTTPPKETAQMLHAEGDWPDLPPLVSLSGVPVLRPDGTVHDTPGYDEGSRIFYDAGPGGELPPKVPPEPSEDDVLKARGLIDQMLGDFPFASEIDHANAWGLLLTPIARPWTPGPVPLALIDKPKMGSGASLLAEVVATVATGNAPFLGAPTREEEWSKVITSALLAGLPVLTFDNIEEKINSAVLSRALTSPIYADRLLGTNTVAHLPQRSTWIATGNNLAVGGDLPRRCYSIRLDPKHPRPWQRSDFKIPELVGWVRARRGELVSALLTLCVAWHNADRPLTKHERKRIGGFEGWDRAISGILAHAGIDKFLGNLDEFYETADEEGGEWEAFLAAWYEHGGSGKVTVKDLVGRFGSLDGQHVRDALPADLADAYENNHTGFTRKLGNALTKHSGARYGNDGYYALEDGTRDRAKLWRVLKDR
jgi:hypothetical protein